jgi:hypothetical protein
MVVGLARVRENACHVPSLESQISFETAPNVHGCLPTRMWDKLRR